MDENWPSPGENEWTSWAIPSSPDAPRDGEENGHRPAASPFGALPASPEQGPNLDDLQRAQSALWSALRSEDDPDVRMQLLSRLSENRAAILALGAGDRPGAGTAPVEQASPRRSGRHLDGGFPGLAPHAGDRRGIDPTAEQARNIPPSIVGQDFDSSTDDSADYGAGNGSGGDHLGGVAAFDASADGGMSFGHPDLVPAAESAGDGRESYDEQYETPGYRFSPDSRYAMGSGEDRGRESSSAFAAPAAANQARPPSIPDPPTGGERITSRSVFDGEGAGRGLSWLQSNMGRLGEPQTGQRVLVLAGALLSVIGVAWLILAQPFGGGGETSASGDGIGSETSLDDTFDAAQISSVLRSVGLDGVTAEQRADGIYLVGTVDNEAQAATAVGVVKSMVAEGVNVVSELVVATSPTSIVAIDDAATARAAAMQAEINRVVAATPLIFETSKTDLTELHLRILNNVASILKAYPGLPVKVIGYTDHVGSDDANTALSESRAANVKAYLVSQGVSPDDLITEALGASASTGSDELASLERRVSFTVVTVPAAAPPASAPLRIAVVAPSARNDLAFTQSMFDAVNVIAAERGNVEVQITDSTFVPADAAAAIRGYADGGYDLIIAHGVEFGTELLEIVKAHPDIVFAWGTATDTFNLPNLYAYDAAAEQGGYVMGAMAAMLSNSGTIGVVGPIEVADAKRYIEGFKAGALAEKPTANVPVVYTGSFADIALASETASNHVAAGADVLTGTAEMVVGAIQVAHDNHALWFGTQANQASLAPDVVVASQVYHWEILLRPIVADIDAGTPNGRGMVANLADGGLVIEFNPDYPLPDPVKQRAEQLAGDIRSGALAVTF